MLNRILIIAISLFVFLPGFAQNHYSIDATRVDTTVSRHFLKLGSPGNSGKQIEVNSRYLTIGNKPAIPVMGEVHFSRIPESQWKPTLLKMKACGVTIVSSYVIWIHHEAIEGEYDWSGNLNLRKFAQTCADCGLYFFVRVGPWCHAEVRNGGTPDWLLTQEGMKERRLDPMYLSYVQQWFHQIGLQLKGMMYKDGGPVIGVQLENEYRRGKGGEAYILKLKQMVKDQGLDAPLYTVTGWGNSSVPPAEVIPMWGVYPDAPWQTNLEKFYSPDDYRFLASRNNLQIGNEGGQSGNGATNTLSYPYFTCEMGIGVMNTDHRRVRIGKLDGTALILSRLGAGCNLPGYYVFAGGSNPLGLYSTMEENKVKTGSWNTNPAISYDFQAAIRESGELAPAYQQLKPYHYFLDAFGSRMAPMVPLINSDDSHLNYSYRTDGNAGFLFGMNYCRNGVKKTVKNVHFTIQTAKGNIEFPKKAFSVPDSSLWIWPVNFKLNYSLIRYATAMPVAHRGNQWVFVANGPVDPEFLIDAKDVESVTCTSAKIRKNSEGYWLSELKPGTNCCIHIQTQSGKKEEIYLLSKADAEQLWVLDVADHSEILLSSDGIYSEGRYLHSFGASSEFKFQQLAFNLGEGFHPYHFSTDVQHLNFKLDSSSLISHAKWLRIGQEKAVSSSQQLNHHFFWKQINLSDPSQLSQASLQLAVPVAATVWVNGRKVNQSIRAGYVQQIDLTGYLKKGINQLLIDFHVMEGEQSFAAVITTRFANESRMCWYTDSSWLSKTDYRYPAYGVYSGFKTADAGKVEKLPVLNLPETKIYRIQLSNIPAEQLNACYLKLNYDGNKAELFNTSKLIADNFNDGSEWSTNLLHFPFSVANQTLTLELTPLKADDLVYFDDELARQKSIKHTGLTGIQLIPEYGIDLKIENGKLIQLK